MNESKQQARGQPDPHRAPRVNPGKHHGSRGETAHGETNPPTCCKPPSGCSILLYVLFICVPCVGACGQTASPPFRSRRGEGRLLANSGCFVIGNKCVLFLWCFVVFCGCFVVFCGCFAVFCECFAVFLQNTQNTRKTSSKNTEKNKKNSQYARVLREFSKSKKN